MSSETDVGDVPLGSSPRQPDTHDRTGAPAPAPIVLPAQRSVDPPRAPWAGRFRSKIIIADVASILVAAGVVEWYVHRDEVLADTYMVTAIGPLAVALTLLCLAATRAWDVSVLGQGSEEFARLIRAIMTSAVVLGLAGLALLAPHVRPWVFGFAPLGGAIAALMRYVLRKSLHRARGRGECLRHVLAAGTVESVSDLIARTRRDTFNGLRVTGVCTPDGHGPDGAQEVLGVPVLGDFDAVSRIARTGGHHAVAVGGPQGWGAIRLHQLAWDLEDAGAELMVDPGLMDISGPRVHITPIDGLPLLRLTEPTLTGVPFVLKYSLDRIGAAMLLVVLAPVLLALAVAVRLDGGPVFYRQERVGRHGNRFTIVKFRSMVVDADARKAELVATNDGAGPLFKMRADPRVTRVGTLLRRYSLDELPQLFNVLAGSMSLVGPRPPLPEEVESYTRDASRKFLVKPGLTGLWQVSGRSDLSWEESVRLDLRYVENWSLALDVMILWKTFGAVAGRSGAY